MAKKYYIVGNRAFNTSEEAKNYCNENDFGYELIVEVQPVKNKYYELQVQPTGNKSIYHNSFYTEEELQQQQKYIRELKNGEYCSNFIHLKEITENEYNKMTAN